MAMRQRGKPKLRHPVKRVGGTAGPSIDEIIREARQKKSADGDYRERSLRIHGLICAKCGREFDHRIDNCSRCTTGTATATTIRPTAPTGRTSARTATTTSTAVGFWRTI